MYIQLNEITYSSINHAAKYTAQNRQHKYTTLTVNWHPDKRKKRNSFSRKS
jgi:hypothetical protein